MENDKTNPGSSDRQSQPTVVDMPSAKGEEFTTDNTAVSASVSTANNLTVYARKGDQRHAVEIDSSADVSELRARIAEAFVQTPEHITLIYAGRILENGVTLQRANVQDKHAMHVVVRQPRSSAGEANQRQPQQPHGQQHSEAAGMQQHPFLQMFQGAFSGFPLFGDGHDEEEIQVGAVQFGHNNDEAAAMHGGIPQQLPFSQQMVFVFDGNRMVPVSVNGNASGSAMPPNSLANNSNANSQQFIDDDLFADSSSTSSVNASAPADTNVTVQQEVVLIPAMISSGEAGPASNSNTNNNGRNSARAAATNPQMREFLESHPEFTHALSNQEALRQTLQVARNPNLMLEMMRNHDRALSNLESLPGGLTALERYYNEYQRPLMDAAQPGEMWSQGLPAQPNFLFPFPFFQRPGAPTASQDIDNNAPLPPPAENRNPLPNAWRNGQQQAGAFPPGNGFFVQAVPNGMPDGAGGASSPGDAIAQALGMANGTQDASALQAMGAMINEAIGQAEAQGADQIEFNFQFAPSEHAQFPGDADFNVMMPAATIAASDDGGGDADNAAAAAAITTVPATDNKSRLPTAGSVSTTSNTSLESLACNPPTPRSTTGSQASNPMSSFFTPNQRHSQLPAQIDARNIAIAQQLAAMRISSGADVQQQQSSAVVMPTPLGAPTAVMNPRIIAEALRLVTDRRALVALHVLHAVAPTLFPVDPLGILLLNQRHQQQQLQAAQQHQMMHFGGGEVPHHVHAQRIHQPVVAVPRPHHHQHHHQHAQQYHQQLHAAAHRAAVQQAVANAPPPAPGTANVIVCSTRAPIGFATVNNNSPMAAMRGMMATAPVPAIAAAATAAVAARCWQSSSSAAVDDAF